MEPPFFEDFPGSSKQKWRERLEKELKGRPYQDILHEVADQLFLEPYYVAEDLDQVPGRKEIQQSQKSIPGWLTVPLVQFQEPGPTNLDIRRQLEHGSDAVWLDCNGTTLAQLELTKTLHTIRLTDSPVFLDTPESAPELIKELSQGSSYYLKGGIVHDALAHWMRTGRDYQGSFEAIAEGMALTRAMREFKSYKVESHVFHEAGADVVQELAFTMATFVTYLDQLTECGVSALLAANRFVFSISVGTEYLTEIAKLRALRYLYRKITRAYQLPDALCHPYIHAQSSRFYHSVRSPHTNIIRQSAEAMSAVMGGCDALTVLPFEVESLNPTEFSERVARNISLVLKNESYLDKVADPAAGSYYLEIETAKLAEAAWTLFLDIEERGGLCQAFEQNFIQNQIKNAWNQTVERYHDGKVRVGVNKYLHGDEPEVLLDQPPSEPPSSNRGYALLQPRNLDHDL